MSITLWGWDGFSNNSVTRQLGSCSSRAALAPLQPVPQKLDALEALGQLWREGTVHGLRPGLEAPMSASHCNWTMVLFSTQHP